jgi:hypothetical protein
MVWCDDVVGRVVMRKAIRTSLPLIGLGIGLLTAPIAAWGNSIDVQLQLDATAKGISAYYLKNGVEQLPNTGCGKGNCDLGEGFYVTSPSVAVNSTVKFNVYDGLTLIGFGDANFDYEPDGGLQDFDISLNYGIDGLGFPSPYTAADHPVKLFETGAYQTVSAISGIPGSDGNTYNVELMFRTDIAGPTHHGPFVHFP